MVVGAAPVLSGRRALALSGLAAAFAVYTALAERLPDLPLTGDVTVVALLLLPAVTAMIWLALPLARLRGTVLLVASAVAGLGILVAGAFDLGLVFLLAKIATFTLLGFWFLGVFEALWWIALVAVLVPLVDVWSVNRGPTHYVLEDRPSVFLDVSVTFAIPGGAETAIGPPDILFFALLLGAAQRFGLRVGWTWVAMTALLGVTLVIAATVVESGLPALPAVCAGFLAANADLIWRDVRSLRRGRSGAV